MFSKKCLIEDCEKPVRTRSLCLTHYNQWYAGYIQVDNIPKPMTPEEAGAIGGKIGRTGGFYQNRELARTAGRLGGMASKRNRNK